MHVRVYAFVKHYYRGSNLLGIIEYGKDIFGEYFVEWLQSGCRKRSRKMKNAECSQSDIFFDPVQQLPSLCQKYRIILSSADCNTLPGVGRRRHMSLDPPQNPSESPMANTVMVPVRGAWRQRASTIWWTWILRCIQVGRCVCAPCARESQHLQP
jgi:hypothetical protein